MSARTFAWLAGLGGFGLVVLACIQAYRYDEGDALIGLALVGATLLLFALLHQRFEAVKFSATSVELTLSRSIVELGAPKAAQLLERSGLTGMVESYEFVQRELSDPTYRPARIRLQDALVEQAASLSRTEKLDPQEVHRLFRDGSPLLRVLTLGLMKGDPSLADGAVVLSAVSTSRSANEQFHGLMLARLLWRNLSPGDRAAVLAAADADPHITDGTDRFALLEELRASP